jgi:hypothetical protein
MSGWQSKKAAAGDKLSDEMVKLVVQECIGLLSKDLQNICLTTFDLRLKDAILERQTRSISEYFSITYKGVAPKQHS